jgi:uncharacterized damage-inducible protein DinB
MTSSLLGDAIAHHVWATDQLIGACTALTPQQLETFAPGTRGPIIETLRHIVGSDGWYLSFFRAERPVPADAEKTAGLHEMRSMIAANGAAWAELLAGEIDPDADIVETDEDGVLYSAIGVRLAQVVHHGTDHRSQICTALTSLGVTPPDIDVWAYARAVGRERWVPAPTS